MGIYLAQTHLEFIYIFIYFQNEEEPGILEEMKTVICSIAQMFASKYGEDLQPYLGEFVTSVWNLLTTTGKAPKFDLLISNAINFLSCVASKDPNRNLFEVPDVLDGICKRVILPNMEFRLTDEELFEVSIWAILI